MAKIPGSVPIGGFIAPTDSTDVCATHDDLYGRGGYKIVDDLTARDAIPSGRRKEGAPVYVKSEDKEYRLVGGITNSDWVSNSSNILISVTYAELVDLIDNSDLIAGQKYLLSDYATTHYFLDGDSAILTARNVATTEPIIVTAATSNSLAPIAISTIYPQDIIHYDWNPANWLNDRSFSDVDVEGYNSETTSIIPGFKGVITYREDTIQKNITHYDFRGVKFRRWAVDQPAWNSGTTYAKDAKVSDSGYIYTSLVSGNVGNAVSDTTKWIQILNYNNTSYWSWNSSEFNGITSDPDDYFDFYTFHYYSEIADNVIGLKTNYYEDPVVTTILPNIVFVEQSDTDGFGTYYCQHNRIEGGFSYGNVSIGKMFYSNRIGPCFNNNSIGPYFYDNTVASGFSANIIGESFIHNSVGPNFNANIIGQNIYDNVIASAFASNIIGLDAYNNTIGAQFYGNSIGAGFVHNSIGPNANNNTIGSDFSSNSIGANFQNNSIGTDFYNNSIGTAFQANSTGTGFSSNSIGTDFYNNSIGTNFRNNTVYSGIQSVNFTSATHVYADYDCTIFRNSALQAFLKYYDGTNSLIIVNMTD